MRDTQAKFERAGNVYWLMHPSCAHDNCLGPFVRYGGDGRGKHDDTCDVCGDTGRLALVGPLSAGELRALLEGRAELNAIMEEGGEL